MEDVVWYRKPLLSEPVAILAFEGWSDAGNTDTGFSFYTRRATLAAVYSATLLAWLADNSGDMGKTVAFLDRRLANLAAMPRATAPLRGVKVAGEQFARAMLKTVGRRHAR